MRFKMFHFERPCVVAVIMVILLGIKCLDKNFYLSMGADIVDIVFILNSTQVNISSHLLRESEVFNLPFIFSKLSNIGFSARVAGILIYSDSLKCGFKTATMGNKVIASHKNTAYLK